MNGASVKLFRGFYAQTHKMHYRYDGLYQVKEVSGDKHLLMQMTSLIIIIITGKAQEWEKWL